MQTRAKAAREEPPAYNTRIRSAADPKRKRLMAATAGVETPNKKRSVSSPVQLEAGRWRSMEVRTLSSALGIFETGSSSSVGSTGRSGDAGVYGSSGIGGKGNSRNRTAYIEESSSKKPNGFICTICMEPGPLSKSFGADGCSHVYCVGCITKYLVSKIQQKASLIRCPDPNCRSGTFVPERCQNVLTPEVFEQWCAVLWESVVLGSTRFYCPFKDCSAPLMNEGDSDRIIRESECPHCWRLFCAQCKVPWHADISCEKFQMMDRNERTNDDVKLLLLAKHSKWQRCPKCKFFVERTEGCRSITCRCKFVFCYGCGKEMIQDHYCATCHR